MHFIDALKKKDSTENNAMLEHLPIVCEDEFSPSTHTHRHIQFPYNLPDVI